MNALEWVRIAGFTMFLALSMVTEGQSNGMKGWLMDASALTSQTAQPLKEEGIRQLVIAIHASPSPDQLKALTQLKEEGLEIWYWIEIARDEAMATAHPEWMSSIQGHPEWRRFYPDFPEEKDHEVVKVYPWVPVFYQGAFDAHLEKVNRRLEAWPTPKGIFLNDLQGAPTACGCGHPLCRWTTDYGPKKTASNLGHDAPARFLEQIQKAHPQLECIPVWATECEAHDKDVLCAGVGCYNGACWREWSKQLEPIAKTSTHIAALLSYKELERDLDVYGETAAWIPKAIESFAKESTRFHHPEVPSKRLIGILQGWEVSPREEAAQISQLETSGAQGYILSKMRIHSGWEPRIIRMNDQP